MKNRRRIALSARNSSSLHKFVRLQRPFNAHFALGLSIRSHSSTFPPREAATLRP